MAVLRQDRGSALILLYRRQELEADLREAGFDTVTVTGDLTGRPPRPEEDRWIFRCRKPINSKVQEFEK